MEGCVGVAIGEISALDPRPFARLHSSVQNRIALTKTDPGRFHCPLPKIFGGSVAVHCSPITITKAVDSGCHSAISSACLGSLGFWSFAGSPCRACPRVPRHQLTGRCHIGQVGTSCTADQPHALQGRLGTVQYGTADRRERKLRLGIFILDDCEL